ncbi:MAG: hypothetical protein ACYDH0_03515 [Candidatus Aminicenantales bacterium]
MKRLFLVPLVTLMGIASAGADDFSLSLSHFAADNIFQTREQTSDRISALTLSVDKAMSKFSLFSEGGYTYFARNPGLGFGTLAAGLDFLHPLSKKSAFYVSGTADAIFFRPESRDFNRAALSMNAAFKAYLGPSSILRSGYTMEYRNYGSRNFDFLSQAFQLTLDRYFETKTSVKAGFAWGYKYFLHPFTTTPLSETSQSGGGDPAGAGWRHGADGRDYSRPGSTENGGAGIQNCSLSAVVAQGIGSRMGISFSGTRQWTLSGKSPFLYVEEYYMAENPTYDSFSWEGWNWGAMLTAEVPWDIELKIGYTMSRKAFPGIESLGLDGSPLGLTREDRRRQTDVRVEKDFSKFTLFLSYSFIRNGSSDPFFDWKGRFVSGGIQWNISFGKTR